MSQAGARLGWGPTRASLGHQSASGPGQSLHTDVETTHYRRDHSWRRRGGCDGGYDRRHRHWRRHHWGHDTGGPSNLDESTMARHTCTQMYPQVVSRRALNTGPIYMGQSEAPLWGQQSGACLGPVWGPAGGNTLGPAWGTALGPVRGQSEASQGWGRHW